MSWLNSLLVALTSVEPHWVPFTVIGLVTFAFFCFIFFYLVRAVRIVNGLKNTRNQLTALKTVHLRLSLGSLRACFSDLNSGMPGMSSKNRCTCRVNRATGKRTLYGFGRQHRVPAFLRAATCRYSSEHRILQTPARYSYRCGDYRYLLWPDDWSQSL